MTNTTVVNTATMCELLREVAGRGLVGPVTFVPDNAHIERLWKFIKRKELYGKYHARFDDFRAAIQTCLSQISTVHQNPLKSLMTLNFQTFANVSLLSA